MSLAAAPAFAPEWALLVKFATFGLGTLLFGGLAAVVYGLAVGHINTRNLLTTKADTPGAGSSSPARAPLLALTLFGALYYLLQVIHDPTRFPELPKEILYAVGGSNALYLTAKANNVLRRGADPAAGLH